MSTADNITGAVSWAGEECVAYVSALTGVGGPGSGVQNASDYLTKYSAAQVKAPAVGDIAVWGANVNGAGSAGHVAVVSSVSPTGQVSVTGTNWPHGSKATTNVIGQNAVGMGAPSAYIDPSKVSGGSQPGTLTSAPAVIQGSYQSLGALLGDVPGAGLPVAGGVIQGASAPFVFMDWVSQRRVWATALAVLAGLAIMGLGVMLLLRRDVSGAALDAARLRAAA